MISDPKFVNQSTFLKMIWNQKDKMDPDRFKRYPGHQGIYDIVEKHEKKR